MVVVWSVFMLGSKETYVLQLAPIIIYGKQWIYVILQHMISVMLAICNN
jgi:hypothetical protein